MNFKHVLTVIILVSIFSGCISQPESSETSIPKTIPTAIPKTTMADDRQMYALTSASIDWESETENITIYVPVLLDENKSVLKMYDKPEINGNITIAIIDTEHGKALKIIKSGLGNNDVNINESHEKLKADEQTFDEFFKQFTISMSNYESPEHFIQMPISESDPEIEAWVYSESDIEKFSIHFTIDPKTSLYESGSFSSGIALDIGPQRWIHLRKGWQAVNLSLRKMVWDAVRPGS